MELTPEQREQIYREEALKRQLPATKVRRGNGFSAVIGASLLLLAFVGCGRLFSGPATPEEKAGAAARDAAYEAEHERTTAALMAQQFMKDKLKAPGSAEFADAYDENVTRISKDNSGNYNVLSYVDSENSFGAKLRMKYVCTLHPTGGDNWQLDNLITSEGE